MGDFLFLTERQMFFELSWKDCVCPRVLHLCKLLNCSIHIGPESRAALTTQRPSQELNQPDSTKYYATSKTNKNQLNFFSKKNIKSLEFNTIYGISKISHCRIWPASPAESHPHVSAPVGLSKAILRSDSQRPWHSDQLAVGSDSWLGCNPVFWLRLINLINSNPFANMLFLLSFLYWAYPLIAHLKEFLQGGKWTQLSRTHLHSLGQMDGTAQWPLPRPEKHITNRL